MTRWLAGEGYEDCLLSKKADYLKQIKFGCLSKDDAVNMAEVYTSKMKETKAKYMEEHTPTVNRAVDYVLNQTLIDLFKYNFKSEIGCVA